MDVESGRLIPHSGPLDRIPADAGGFYFIANILDVPLTLPVTITPSIRLDRADTTQVSVIQKSLDNSGNFDPTIRRKHYECDWIEVGNGYRAETIPDEKWRYYILSFSGYGGGIIELLKISALTPPYISAFVSFSTTSPFGCGFLYAKGLDPFANQSFYFGQTVAKPYSLTTYDIENIQQNLELYNLLDPVKHEGIRRAVNFHDTIRRAKLTGSLDVLAYFIIIEMLLTHNPNYKEIGDSISHQLRTKISFLSDRLPNKFDYGVFGSDVSHDKI